VITNKFKVNLQSVLEGDFSIFFKKRFICPNTMPKDSPEFITWLERLPQCKSKDDPEFFTCINLLPHHKPKGHPDRVAWELSLSGILFDERMKDLRIYKKEFGNCNISQYQEGFKYLRAWVNNIGKAKNGRGEQK